MSSVPDQLPILMREWAEWYEKVQVAGWSSETAIARLMEYGPVPASGFASSLPKGVHTLESRGALRRLISALTALEADEDAVEPVKLTEAFYLVGPQKVVEATGKSKAGVYNVVKVGEALIRREMKLR